MPSSLQTEKLHPTGSQERGWDGRELQQLKSRGAITHVSLMQHADGLPWTHAASRFTIFLSPEVLTKVTYLKALFAKRKANALPNL